MELGSKIKSLRNKRGITQEKLAEELGISFQAISKWENNVSMPDIQLLPQIAIYFGVTIDELFELSSDERFRRIEHMLDDERSLSDSQFAETLSFLEGELNKDRKSGRAQTFLAALYKHRSKSYGEIAVQYAKESIQLIPNNKDYRHMHNVLVECANGVICDWNVANHTHLIDFYYEIIGKNPSIAVNYMYLLDLLIADKRIDEAKQMLSEYQKLKDHKQFMIPDYEAKILMAQGKTIEAKKKWAEQLEKYPDNFLAWFCRADAYVRECEYDKAIECYMKSYEIQPKPCMYDALWAVANIYEIRKEFENAANIWDQIVEVTRTDWEIEVGEEIEFPIREAARLRASIK